MILMLDMNNLKWEKIDKFSEELTKNGIRYIRPVGNKALSIDCPCCKKLISTVEDVASLKSIDACEECNIIFYHPNKEKWLKGWRPKLDYT